MRILFVAMERGGTFDPFRKDAPNEPTFAHTQMNFRRATELRENAHMGGTSELMECLVDDKEPQVYSAGSSVRRRGTWFLRQQIWANRRCQLSCCSYRKHVRSGSEDTHTESEPPNGPDPDVKTRMKH